MLEQVQQFLQRSRTRTDASMVNGWGYSSKTLGALLLSGLLIVQCMIPLNVMAAGLNSDNTSFWTRPSYERKMNDIGNKILVANNIQTPILFRMSESAMELDAQAESKHHLILVGSALFPMMSSDDELAAVLSHEIAHIITGKSGHLAGGQISLLDILGTVIFVPDAILTTVSMGHSIKDRLGRATLQNRETAMDLIGIDLMTKAGYNPTAMENILREIATDNGNKHWRSRVTITDRLKRIHAAIVLKYPEYLPAQERTPTTPTEPSPAEIPANTVIAPPETSPTVKTVNTKVEGTYQLGAVQENKPILQDAPQIEVPVMSTKGIKAEPIHPETVLPTVLKEGLPKATPEAIKVPAVQHLLDQNGQPLPATPPGVPAALKTAN